MTYNNRMIFKTHEWKGDGERMRNLFETETTISLCSQRQRASLCKLFAYRYVLYSFHQKFYEITFTYDTLHLLLTHHDKHANFYLHSAPRASISITILIPYRLAVKYLFFFLSLCYSLQLGSIYFFYKERMSHIITLAVFTRTKNVSLRGSFLQFDAIIFCPSKKRKRKEKRK